MAMANTNLTVEQITIKGLQQSIREVFKLPTNVTFLATTDRFNLSATIKATLSDKINYPMVFLSITDFNITESGEGYPAKTLLRHGVYGHKNDSLTVTRIPIIPVTMTFEITFLTDSVHQSLEIVNHWMFASVKNSLNMSITFDDHTFDIPVTMEKNLTTPAKDMSVDIPNMYELVGTLNVKGYFSPSVPYEELPQVTLVHTFKARPGLTFDDLSNVITNNGIPNVVDSNTSSKVLPITADSPAAEHITFEIKL